MRRVPQRKSNNTYIAVACVGVCVVVLLVTAFFSQRGGDGKIQGDEPCVESFSVCLVACLNPDLSKRTFSEMLTCSDDCSLRLCSESSSARTGYQPHSQTPVFSSHPPAPPPPPPPPLQSPPPPPSPPPPSSDEPRQMTQEEFLAQLKAKGSGAASPPPPAAAKRKSKAVPPTPTKPHSPTQETPTSTTQKATKKNKRSTAPPPPPPPPTPPPPPPSFEQQQQQLGSHYSVQSEDAATRAIGEDILRGGLNRLKMCRDGLFMLYNPLDRYVGQSFDLYGEYGLDSKLLLQQVVGAGDTVFDVGAGIGSATLALSHMVGAAGAVYAFEPQRLSYQTLCANLAMNSVENTLPLMAAVGSAPTSVFVPYVDFHSPGCHGCVPVSVESTGEERVPMMTVDSFGLDALRLIRIDAAGQEEDVLQGAVQTLTALHPLVYVRAHVNADSTVHPITYGVFKLLESLGYDAYWHFGGYYNQDNYFGGQHNVFLDEMQKGSNSELFLFCVYGGGGLVDGLTKVEMP